MRQSINPGPVSLFVAACMFVGVGSATAQQDWSVTLTDGTADKVELVALSGDSLTIGRDSLKQTVAISSLVRLRRSGSAAPAIGAGVGGGLGLLLGTAVNSFRGAFAHGSTPSWEWSTDGVTLLGFTGTLTLVGGLIGAAVSSNATYDMERLDPAERRALLTRLIATGH